MLHKYIWKCKARRYINSHEDGAPQDNEADARMEERHKYDAVVDEQVAEHVSKYDYIDEDNGVKEDAVYGGYERDDEMYDKQDVRVVEHKKYDFIAGGALASIVKFECGTELLTNGYELIFAAPNG